MPKFGSRSIVPNLRDLGMKYTPQVKLFEAILYTDGSCLGNPGVGGWAYQLEVKGDNPNRPLIKRAQGGVKDTTNNRMELQAIIAGLYATPFDATVHVVTDSQYCINVNTPGGTIKANKELIDILHKLTATRKVTWEWVKAHAGHPQNSLCDAAAQSSAKRMAELLGPK
jgi:ribonuclease HI